VRPEGLGKLEKKITDLIRPRTRDLPARTEKANKEKSETIENKLPAC
jgi:hypothetical protein